MDAVLQSIVLLLDICKSLNYLRHRLLHETEIPTLLPVILRIEEWAKSQAIKAIRNHLFELVLKAVNLG